MYAGVYCPVILCVCVYNVYVFRCEGGRRMETRRMDEEEEIFI